jgi:tripartite-type tricarboxylate transporter receptor subunit TctC
MVAAFPPGGFMDFGFRLSDFAARVLASPLPEPRGQSVVVDNRSGAGGNLGIGLVTRLPPSAMGYW